MNEITYEVPGIWLPWPDPLLWVNKKTPWGKLNPIRREQRESASWSTLDWLRQAGSFVDGWDSYSHFHITWEAYPPNRIFRDYDGIQSAMKAAQDGIFDRLAISVSDGMDDRQIVSWSGRKHTYNPDIQGQVRAILRSVGEIK